MQLAVIVCVMPWVLIASRTCGYTAFRLVGAGLGAVAALAWIGERLSDRPNLIGNAIAWAAQRPLWILTTLAGVSVALVIVERRGELRLWRSAAGKFNMHA
jgi:hypothetical protein